VGNRHFDLQHLLTLLDFLHNQSFPRPSNSFPHAPKPFPKPPKTWKKDKKWEIPGETREKQKQTQKARPKPKQSPSKLLTIVQALKNSSQLTAIHLSA